MTTTPRMKWTLPGENQNPWYDVFVALLGEVDASAYASREDRNLVLTGGGSIHWALGTNQLSWTSPIQVFSPMAGFTVGIIAGNCLLEADGSLLYMALTRAPGSNKTATAAVGSVVPSTPSANDQLLLAVRLGGKVYWRNGLVMSDGETVVDFHVVGFSAGGDLAGTATSQTVVGFQGRPVDAGAPATGQVYKWTGVEWAAGSTFLPTFVFAPGGVAAANVYDDWALLMADLVTLAGPKVIEFDDDAGTCRIPAGTWDLGGDTILRGRRGNVAGVQVQVVCEDLAYLMDPSVIEGGICIYSESTMPILEWSVFIGGACFLHLRDDAALSTYDAGGGPPTSPLINVLAGHSLHMSVGEGCSLLVSPATFPVAVLAGVSQAFVHLFGNAYVGPAAPPVFLDAFDPGALGIVTFYVYSQAAGLWHTSAPASPSVLRYHRAHRQLVFPCVKGLATEAAGVATVTGACWLAAAELPATVTASWSASTWKFRCILESTSALAGFAAVADLADTEDALGGGAGVPVGGSQVDNLLAPNPLVAFMVEADITAAMAAFTTTGVFESRLWITAPGGGNVVTCKSAEIVLEW